MRNKLYLVGPCPKTLGNAARRLGACLLCLLLLATALPLPALANGPEENAWEHTDHEGWTELTAKQLSSKNYSLSTGKYFLSGTDMGGGVYFLDLAQTICIPSGANVVLCLHNVYCTPELNEINEPSFDVAIRIDKESSLTICDCSPEFDYTYLGGSGSMGEDGPAIENHGTLNIVSGTIGYGTKAPAIDNKEGAMLNLCGTPHITEDSDGPHITSAGTISASYNDISYTGDTIVVEYMGETDGTVVTNVTTDNSSKFVGPGNTAFAFDSKNGTLTAGTPVELGSLLFAGQAVADGVPYNVTNSSSEDTSGTAHTAKLVAATEGDYDLLWDEETKTLTLNNAKIVAGVETFSNQEDGLVSINSDDEITVNLIGENTITVFSHYHDGIARNAYAIENTGGNVLVKGEDGSTLKINMHPGTNDTAKQQIAAISAAGTVKNESNLVVSGDPEEFSNWSGMIGISAQSFQNHGNYAANISEAGKVYAVSVDDFTNSGTFTANISDANSACAVDTSDMFVNEENALFNVTIQGGSSGVGVDCQTFKNDGTMDIDIVGEDGAVGIKGYSSANNWTNNGQITIDVGVDGAPAGALGGGALSGIDWRSDDGFAFTNSGTLDVTVTKETASTQNKTQWPVWQLFDTIAVSLMPGGDSTVTNTGTMALKAHNGYTAGLYVAGAKGHSIALKNSGTMAIAVDTLGGENIRAVGIYAEIPAITTGKVGSLPFQVTGGSVRIDAKAAAGSSDVMDDACMAVCLVQSFEFGNEPSDTTGLQQIQLNGMTIDNGGSAIVTGPHTVTDINTGATPTYTSYINTIGNGVTPAASVAILPTIEGTVTIQGTLQVGSTLTAQVTGLPDGVQVAYQWQEADSAAGPFTDIEGANEQTYIPTSDNVGKYLRVVVTPVGDEYGGELTAVTSGTISRPSIPGGTTYPPVIEDSENGTVTTSPSRPEEGDTVTITPKPDEGFEVDEVLVEDEDGNAIKVTQNPDGTYTFTQPDGKVTITVTFRCDGGELCPSYHLTDITKGEWYHAAVDYVVKQGIMAGTSATTFDPNGKLTRAMAVQILYNLEGQPIVTGTTSFADSTAHWAATPIAWAEQTGVVDGYEDNMFRPENNVTRQEFAQMLYNYAAYKGYDLTAKGDLSQFTDGDSVREWAVTAMSWANGNALINGHDDGTLEPAGTTTRAQAASILMRFDQNVVEK